MAIDPPYRFDPWQNLVNVHWQEETTSGGAGRVPIYVAGSAAFYYGGNLGLFVGGGPWNGWSSGWGGTFAGSPYQEERIAYSGPVTFTISDTLLMVCTISSAGGGGEVILDFNGMTFTKNGDVWTAAAVTDIVWGTRTMPPSQYYAFNIRCDPTEPP